MTTGDASTARRLVTVFLVAAVVGSSIVGLVTVESLPVRAGNASTVEGTPHLNASAPDARLTPGQSGTVGISITNDATYDDNNGTHPQEAIDRAGEARSVTVNISDTRKAPLTVETGQQAIGTIQDGETSGPHTFNVVVDEDATAGTYTVEVTTRYRHAKKVTYEEMADGEYAYNETVVNRTETSTITVVIEPEARFEVTDISHDVPLGGEGTVNVSVTNTGDMNVTESTVSLTSSDSNLYFGAGTATSEVSVGPWQAGETKTLRFRAGTADSAVQREYPIDLSVSYRDDDDAQQTDSDQFGITPRARTEFEIVAVSHDVPRDGEGTLQVTVNQTAGKPISDVRVTARTDESEVYLGAESSRSASTFVDEWGERARETLTFRVGTTESALNRSYSIELQFDYTDADDNENSRTEYVAFSPDPADRFTLGGITHDVPQNGEGTLRVNVTQIGNESISDVVVTASSRSSAVYIGSESSRSASMALDNWSAGSQHQLTFRVGTTDSVVDRPYPIDLQFEYTDDANNDNTRTQQIEFRPGGRDQFRIVDLEHDVPKDGVGTVTIQIENTADERLLDLSATASTKSSEVYIGSESSRSGTATLEAIEPSATRTLTYRVGTTANAVNRSYPLEVNLEYTDDANNDNQQTEQVEFRPGKRDHFHVVDVEHDVPQNGVGEVTVEIENTADERLLDLSATASTRSSEVYIGSESSRSGTATLESIEPGATRTLSYRVGTTANAVNRSYPLEVNLEYTDDANNDNQQTEQVEFRPRPEPQFRVVAVEHDAPAGGAGRLSLTLRNTGPVNATDASLTIASDVDALYFGTGGSSEPVQAGGFSFEPPQTGTPTSAAYIGDWPVDTTRTVSFRLGFDENAIEHPYATDLTVEYENEDGEDMPSTSTSIGIEPHPEPRFALENIDSDLSVGEEGNLIGVVTNTANQTVDGVVLSMESQYQNINVYNPRYAIGSLQPEESERFRFRVSVTEAAEHGPRLFEIATRYRDPDGEVRTTDSQDLLVDVGPDERVFTLARNQSQLSPGQSGTIAITVTNRHNETLRNVQAKLFTDDPLESDDDAAFISKLAPGESTQITMDLSVAGSAMEKTYSVSLDFRYDNARGESRLSDTYRVGVAVSENEGGPDFPMMLGAAFVVSVVGVVGWLVSKDEKLDVPANSPGSLFETTEEPSGQDEPSERASGNPEPGFEPTDGPSSQDTSAKASAGGLGQLFETTEEPASQDDSSEESETQG